MAEHLWEQAKPHIVEEAKALRGWSKLLGADVLIGAFKDGKAPTIHAAEKSKEASVPGASMCAEEMAKEVNDNIELGEAVVAIAKDVTVNTYVGMAENMDKSVKNNLKLGETVATITKEMVKCIIEKK